jgi:hypothetical protein
MSGQIYGDFAVSVSPLPVEGADRILGVQLSRDPQGRPDFVTVQYQSAEGQPFRSVRMDYVNALFLLSCLKSMQLDEGTPFPDDPRA